MRAAFLAVILAGCAAQVPDDGEAFDAPAQPIGKADAAAFTGIYASHASHHYNGDVPDLELRSDGQFVRERCYRGSCALQAPEFGAFDQYTSSSGHTYVRFYSAYDATKVVDVYEIRASSKGVQLRKAYQARWQSLYLSSAGLACASSGGSWSGADCACPLNQPGVYPAQAFVPGAGGCIAMPGANESSCDDSMGMWTDDDSTLIDSYCICPAADYLDSTGACTAI